MKNVKALFYILFFMTLVILHIEQQQEASASISHQDMIPEDAIRLRILAHDDSPGEQLLKREVRDAVTEEIRVLVQDLQSREEARERMRKNMDHIEEVIQNVLEENLSDHTFTLQLKEDVTFPTRMYGPIVYPAGTYEALVVSIGEGEGENWWCVLFPPLCFIPAEEEETEPEKTENQQHVDNSKENVDEEEVYSFFVVEKWKDWFGSNS
ncbi:stage II sporulation protein R [Alteribacillus iranensis]|uniref:Stage II sporulation protein R n=1 Tax=Alteribacillus iranensis TaxID=930128 RepID=A0A1I2BZM2_9BACI|nr:stage II sporulation protein R [Alteribacillus iranensis]SFE61601.1 stage II sporulation protein R [Alteribacillus iranensis]